MSPSSIIWYRPMGGDARRLGCDRAPDGKIGSLPPGLWLRSTVGWLPRTGISSGTLRSFRVWDYLYLLPLNRVLQFKTDYSTVIAIMHPSMLWHCWLYDKKGIRPVKSLSSAAIRATPECSSGISRNSEWSLECIYLTKTQ